LAFPSALSPTWNRFLGITKAFCLNVSRHTKAPADCQKPEAYSATLGSAGSGGVWLQATAAKMKNPSRTVLILTSRSGNKWRVASRF